MRLLIVTQKVDRTDPILAFFHKWIAEFAERCVHVTVIGQRVGSHDLPENVTVLSLGKELGRPRVFQILRFWMLIIRNASRYDTVFVHMTPIWMVLGGPLWMVLQKKRYLWYEARGGGWSLPLALRFVKKVFGASSFGLPQPSPKHVITGHGIDTEEFAPEAGNYEEGLIVAVGRITPIKHFDVILKVLSQLPERYHLTIAGGTITDRDKEELAHLKTMINQLDLRRRVSISWVDPWDIADLFQRAELSLSACGGGLDKVVLQAMACGCPVVYTGSAAEGVLPKQCLATNETMLDTVEDILALSSDDRSRLCNDLRMRVEENHSLPVLIQRLAQEMEN